MTQARTAALSVCFLVTLLTGACKPTHQYAETFGPEAPIDSHEQAATRAEGSPSRVPSATPSPEDPFADARAERRREIESQMREKAYGLEDLRPRILAVREELASLQSQRLDSQDELERGLAFQKLENQEIRLQWELALSELAAAAQSQSAVVQKLAARAQELRAMRMATTEVAEVDARLAQESARLETIQAQQLNSRIESQRAGALQSTSLDWQARTGQNGLLREALETRARLESELSSLEKESSQIQQKQVALQSSLDQLGSGAAATSSAR